VQTRAVAHLIEGLLRDGQAAPASLAEGSGQSEDRIPWKPLNRAAWPQVLVAQRTSFRISMAYVQALEDARRSEVAIRGLLLVDGLDEPPSLPSEGRVPVRNGAAELPDPIRQSEGRPVGDGAGGRPGGGD
jgi:hypothetical protein